MKLQTEQLSVSRVALSSRIPYTVLRQNVILASIHLHLQVTSSLQHYILILLESYYYQYHPFVTFDTAFENGAYVIFAVATISTQSYDKDYLDLSLFQAATVSWRQEAIDELRKLSIYNTSRIHVEPEDQILMMMTCATDDTERKVIAARRIRENETKEANIIAIDSVLEKYFKTFSFYINGRITSILFSTKLFYIFKNLFQNN